MKWPPTSILIFGLASCIFANDRATASEGGAPSPRSTLSAGRGHALVLAESQPQVESLIESVNAERIVNNEAGTPAGTPPGTQVYRNVIGGGPILYRPGAGQRMADDIAIASGPCSVVYYSLRVAGINQGGGATFDVQTALWNGDPCLPGSAIISGTQATFTALPNNQIVIDLEAVLPNAVNVPGTVWLAATFSSNDGGWVRAGQAEVGSTTNIWSENHVKLTPEDLPTGCQLFNFSATGTPWAGFWAQVNCDLPGDQVGACCNGITCTQTTEAACSGGVWQGAFTSCQPNVCLSGACCTGSTFASCSETTQDQCAGGLFRPGGLCSLNACTPNFKVFENSFNTNIFDYIEPGVLWGDDLKLGIGSPCALSGYDVLVAGNELVGPSTFNVRAELWTNNERGTPAFDGDDVPGALIPGTQRDFLNVVANRFSQRLLAGPFEGINLPKKVWIVLSTNVATAGPVMGGNAVIGSSLDGFAKFNHPQVPGAWSIPWEYGGHTPNDCPGISCLPAGSFRAQVWCAGSPPTGACCNDSAGSCTDGISQVDCNGRWRVGETCANSHFDPPCGAGSCCFPQFIPPDVVMLCVDATPEECVDLDGAFKAGRFCDSGVPDAVECPMYQCVNRTGDCFTAHASGGCEDPWCCDIICDDITGDPFCCNTTWDQTCAQSASQRCERPLTNDNCSNAQVISGTGAFPFDNTAATTDGPIHASCATLGGDEQITNDLWYCWTAPCTTQALARTCGSTSKDTKIAVYQGCNCPPQGANLLDCDDDRCSVQSMSAFDAVQGQQYLIRVGNYPGQAGGAGALTVSCGPPPHSGCPAAGNCCAAHTPGGCSDATCCSTVCLCDPFCCTTEWDVACAGNGFEDNRCGAALLCENVCTPPCPTGGVTFVNPPSGLVDARRPHAPNNPANLEGIKTLVVQAPAGSDRLDCWNLCETEMEGGSPNSIVNVAHDGRGQYTLTLNRPITQGAATTVRHLGGGAIGTFISHPANVNSDSAAVPTDILDLIDNLNGVRVPPLSIWQCDIDRSGSCLPADIITEIDLLNGSNGFRVWNGTAKPATAGVCP